MPPVIELTTEQLVARRDEILHSLALATYGDFRSRAQGGVGA